MPSIYPKDVFGIADTCKEVGLLTANCLHLSAMRRLNLNPIATLDEGFKQVKGLEVTPPQASAHHRTYSMINPFQAAFQQ